MLTTGVEVSDQAMLIAKGALVRRAYQKLFEFERLIEMMLERQPSSVLEIGTAEGGAFWAFSQAATPDAVMVSVDYAPSLDEPCVSEDVIRSYTLPTQRCVTIRGDSQLEETRDLALAESPDGYDFLFIDADHTLPAVTRDHELYAPLVRPGGLIVFHDIMEPKVRRIAYQRPTEVDLFWDALDKPAGRTWEFIDYSDTSFGGIGVYEQA